MSDPITAAVIGSVIVGGGMKAAGAIKSGNASYAQAQYQAQISEQNQKIAALNATDAINAGKVQEAQSRRQTTAMAGQQRAILAGLGQQLDTGTAGSIVSDTAQLGEADAQQIRRNAEREALGFTLQGQQLGSDAIMQRQAGSSARSAGFLNAAGTILSTAGESAYMYGKFKGGH